MSHALAVGVWGVFALIVLVVVGALVIPHMALGFLAIAFNLVTG